MILDSRISGPQSTWSLVTRPFLQRKCACGSTPGPSGECEECKRKRLALQTKLAVNQPGDQYEQEADRVAKAVIGGAAASRSSINSLGSNAAQRERQAAGGEEVSGTPPIVDEVLQSSGQPLEGATRAVMEERFGYDFSRVRIHCDQQAGQSAQAVSADAYTVGHHVVFAPDRYAPSTSAGQQLLAHELVHVVQQSAAAGSAISGIDTPESPRERAAERATERVLSGGAAPAERSVASPRIQRQAAGGGKPTPSAKAPCVIHFRKGTTEFTNAKEFAKCMKAIRAHLKGAGVKKIVELHGYASEEGTAKFNQELSDKRAKIVKLLLGKGGIDTSQLKLSVHGEDNSYRTHEENRRVEVILPAPQVSGSNDQPGPPPGETLRKLYEMAPEPGPEKEKDPVEIEIGKEMRVNVPDSPAWAKIVPDYTIFPQGEAFVLSHFVKVKVTGLSEKRLGFVKIEILEGRNKGDTAEIDRANLGPAAASSGPAHTRFTLSSNEFWYGGKGPVKAISHSAKLLPTGRYDVQIPDYSHDKGDKYGDYATTWFLVGDSSDKYLHPGFASLGCVTVEIKMGDTTTWPAIWKHLISARKDDKYVGDIEINAGGLSVCERECNEEFERCLKTSSTGGMECMPVKQACYAKCAQQP